MDMQKHWFLLCAIAVGLLGPIYGNAQEVVKAHRIGFLWPGGEARAAVNLEALRKGLRDLGYDEKNTIDIKEEYADGATERIPALVSELLGFNVEIIVTASIPAALAAKKAAPDTSIVVGAAGDFVGNKLAANMDKPDGNITGVDEFVPDVSANRLKLLHEAMPLVKSFAILSSATGPTYARQMEESAQIAQSLGLTLKTYKVTNAADIEPAFTSMANDQVGGLLVFSGVLTALNSKNIVGFAASNKLTAMYWTAQFTTDGGLMYYGPKLPAMFTRAASFVHRILIGEKVEEIPIEYAREFELVINLKSAHELGIDFPDSF